MGCIAERAFYHYTKRKVGGVLGTAWVWTFLYISSTDCRGRVWVGLGRNDEGCVCERAGEEYGLLGGLCFGIRTASSSDLKKVMRSVGAS